MGQSTDINVLVTGTQAIPEPGTISLFGFGGLAVLAAKIRGGVPLRLLFTSGFLGTGGGCADCSRRFRFRLGSLTGGADRGLSYVFRLGYWLRGSCG